MATAEQIKSLIQSHFMGSDERFATIALQIAAHEARSGHSRQPIHSYVFDNQVIIE